MAVLKEIFKEEKERLIKMEKFYRRKILEMPKGSIVYKKRGKKSYPYLIYRDVKKIRTDYLKLSKDELEKLNLNIKRRRKYLKILKEIGNDLKVLGGTKNG